MVSAMAVWSDDYSVDEKDSSLAASWVGQSVSLWAADWVVWLDDYR